MKFLQKFTQAVGAYALAACGSGDTSSPAAIEIKEAAPQKEAVQATVVTDENYSQAESEIIIANYIKRIAGATGTNGLGQWQHSREGADPKDRTVMRINFDTVYSFLILDLTEPATLTMPETDGRYQSAWVITDEHYNPMAFVEPGTYTLTQESVGRRYVVVVVRTQFNAMDPDDLEVVHALQAQLKVEQKDTGSLAQSNNWDMQEVLAMRARYQKIAQDERITSEVMFGKKGEVALSELCIQLFSPIALRLKRLP